MVCNTIKILLVTGHGCFSAPCAYYVMEAKFSLGRTNYYLLEAQEAYKCVVSCSIIAINTHNCLNKEELLEIMMLKKQNTNGCLYKIIE